LVTIASVAKALLQSLPLEGFPDPKEHCKELFFGTIGCIGVLKDWIGRAWALSHFSGSRVLTLDHLAKTRLPPQTLLAMNDEILAGESQCSQALEGDFRAAVVGGARGPVKVERALGRRKPGTRNPSRDPVGPVSMAEATKMKVV
jgi:hypothetical protein